MTRSFGAMPHWFASKARLSGSTLAGLNASKSIACGTTEIFSRAVP